MAASLGGASAFLADLPGSSMVLALQDLSVVVDAAAIAWVVFNLRGRAVNVVNTDLVAQAQQVRCQACSPNATVGSDALPFGRPSPGSTT